MSKQLNIILDIDNTLVEYSGRRGLKEEWAKLSEDEKEKYELNQGFILLSTATACICHQHNLDHVPLLLTKLSPH